MREFIFAAKPCKYLYKKGSADSAEPFLLYLRGESLNKT